MTERDIIAMMLMVSNKKVEQIATEYETAIKAVEQFIIEYHKENGK